MEDAVQPADAPGAKEFLNLLRLGSLATGGRAHGRGMHGTGSGMADTKDAAAGKSGGGRGRMMIVLLAGLATLAGAGGAGAYFLGMFDSKASAASVPAVEPAGEGAGAGDGHADQPAAGDAGTGSMPAAAPAVIFVDLPEVLVNLSSDSRRMRFLKLRLAVEVSSTRTADTVQQLTPRIMDSFQLYLRGLTVEDLGGPSALYRLKQEMLARINLALDPSRVDDVLFKEMLVQ